MAELILNSWRVQLPEEDRNLLDFLRDDAGLTAAKPTCRTGDCSACLVLLGEIPAGEIEPRYRVVNTCLLTTGRTAGCHVITTEGLTGAGPSRPPAPSLGAPALSPGVTAPLTPVQRTLLEQGGIQCGYCTPGVVIALTAGLINGTPLEAAVSGNLCRCTGYAGIRRACALLEAQFPRRRLTLAEAASLGILPAAVAEAARALAPQHPEPLRPPGEETVVGGATDLAVQRPQDTGPRLRAHRVPGLRGITLEGGHLRIGGAVTVAELQESPLVAAAWPALGPFLDQFASPGIRNSATIGGNIVNASPAADLTVVLLALGADVALAGPNGGRTVPLHAFHLGYRVTDLHPHELLTAIRIPRNGDGAFRLHALKVARRAHDDITSVTSALVAGPGAEGRFGEVRFSAGGVAPVPLLLSDVAAALTGRPATVATVQAALPVLDDAVTPIDDVRGSARYKRDLLRHQLVAHLAALFDLDWQECLA